MVTLPLFENTLEPRSLIIDPPMTDAELEALCLRSENVQIERTREGVICVNPPTGGLTGNGNSEIIRQLGNWCVSERRGRMYDSNTGFFLPDGSLVSPDAAYVSAEQLAGLTKADLTRMPRLCPAFVVELLSQSDSLADARQKMSSWVANGARLAWLVDPYRRCVEVYAPGVDVAIVDGDAVVGSGPVAGFVLELTGVWSCYEV
jgi:Uma2 family endonuclease